MKVLIFGGTGSVGIQTLKVLKSLKHKIIAISFFNHNKLANKLKKQYHIEYLLDLKTLSINDVDQFIKQHHVDLIVNAISGLSGLNYSLLTIKNKIDLALANKESLVIAGQFLIPLAKQNNVNIYPIDSEHSALKCLIDNSKIPIKKYFITASGGKFFNYSYEQLKHIKYIDAITHPNWKMGNKITIDSSTLINKAFEIVEAYWLFNKKVKVLLQPQSEIHALIINKHKNVDCFISKPDMKINIALAINKFKNSNCYIQKFNSLKDINYKLFPFKHKYLIGYKYANLMLKHIKSSIPIIITVADEIAINLFQQNKIRFLDIYKYIDKTIKKFKDYKISIIEDIYTLINSIKGFLKTNVSI